MPDRSRRILVISNLYPPHVIGGYEVACANLVDELRSRGHDVQVLTTRNRREFHLDEQPHVHRTLALADIYDPSEVGNAVALSRRVTGMAQTLANVDALLRALQAGPWDLVLCFNLLGIGGLQIVDILDQLSEQHGVPWLWYLMDKVPSDLRDGLPPGVRALFRFGSDGKVRASSTVCISRGLREEIEDGGVRFAREPAIVPGWAPQPPQAPTASMPRNPDSLTRFVFLGTISAEKGADLILSALAELGKDLHNVAVDFFGPGPIDSYRHMADRLKVGAAVTFHGQVPHADIVPRLASYDAFLFPTWTREPFGFVLFEAASAGLPLITTRGAGATEWLTPFEHYYPVKREARSIATAMASVASDRARARRIGEAAQRHVRDSFLLPQIGDAVEALVDTTARAGQPIPAKTLQDIYLLAAAKERMLAQHVRLTEGTLAADHALGIKEASVAVRRAVARRILVDNRLTPLRPLLAAGLALRNRLRRALAR